MGLAAGQIILDSDLQALVERSYLRPTGRLVQTVAQSAIVNATQTAVTFTAEDWDDYNFHDTAVNPSRVTPNRPGKYRVQGAISVAGQTDYTFVEAAYRFNGATFMPPATRITPSATSGTLLVPVSALIACNGTTDYFELMFKLTRGGAGTSGTVISGQFASVLEWVYEREL